MESKFVEHFFSSLKENEVDYLVLRGYKDLPRQVHNDIDFFVSPDSVDAFFACMLGVSDKFLASVQIVLVRQGVIKCRVDSDLFSISIDFWYNITFWGLSYSNGYRLLSKKKDFSDRKFFIADSVGEFEISFLKEIFHNQRVRCDKIDELKKLLENSIFDEDTFIGSCSSKTFLSMQLVKGCGKHYRLFLVFLFRLVNWNLRKHGFGYSCRSIKEFLSIRFSKARIAKMKSQLFERGETLLSSGAVVIK